MSDRELAQYMVDTRPDYIPADSITTVDNSDYSTDLNKTVEGFENLGTVITSELNNFEFITDYEVDNAFYNKAIFLFKCKTSSKALEISVRVKDNNGNIVYTTEGICNVAKDRIGAVELIFDKDKIDVNNLYDLHLNWIFTVKEYTPLIPEQIGCDVVNYNLNDDTLYITVKKVGTAEEFANGVGAIFIKDNHAINADVAYVDSFDSDGSAVVSMWIYGKTDYDSIIFYDL